MSFQSCVVGIGFLTTVMTTGACEDTSFNGGAAKKQPVVKEDPAIPTATETFKIDGETRAPLDLVWVIDNSGSMSDNIAKVRSNFDAFMTSVSTRIDVKIILLSEATGRLGLALPATAVAQGGIQIDVPVGSLDGAYLAASMSCPAAAGSPGANNFCGTMVADQGYNDYFGVSRGKEYAGRMASYFRPEASRAYIFVTDDESREISGSDFVKVATASAGGKVPKVYSFRGINMQGSGDCEIARVGAQYGVMEQATGGVAFDVCQDDWKSSFDKLAESIKTEAKADVVLKGSMEVATVRVFLDSQELAKSDYTISGQSITIVKVLDKTKTYEVKVTYTRIK